MGNAIVEEQVHDDEEGVEELKQAGSLDASADNGFIPELFVTKSKKETPNTLRQNKLRELHCILVPLSSFIAEGTRFLAK